MPSNHSPFSRLRRSSPRGPRDHVSISVVQATSVSGTTTSTTHSLSDKPHYQFHLEAFLNVLRDGTYSIRVPFVTEGHNMYVLSVICFLYSSQFCNSTRVLEYSSTQDTDTDTTVRTLIGEIRIMRRLVEIPKFDKSISATDNIASLDGGILVMILYCWLSPKSAAAVLTAKESTSAYDGIVGCNMQLFQEPFPFVVYSYSYTTRIRVVYSEYSE
jgi:hypothetical protein